jgi:hypothetical protein
MLLVISPSVFLKLYLDVTESRQHMVRPIDENFVGRPYLLAVARQVNVRAVLMLETQNHDAIEDELTKLPAG